jgi:predicted nucleic acid-binding Zn ribbon protein
MGNISNRDIYVECDETLYRNVNFRIVIDANIIEITNGFLIVNGDKSKLEYNNTTSIKIDNSDKIIICSKSLNFDEIVCRNRIRTRRELNKQISRNIKTAKIIILSGVSAIFCIGGYKYFSS